MRFIEGLPLVDIPACMECPAQLIVIVSLSDGKLERDPRGGAGAVSRWVYGPGTETPWPGGDYYAGHRYIEPAFNTDFTSFMRNPRAYKGFYAVDQDVLMDADL